MHFFSHKNKIFLARFCSQSNNKKKSWSIISLFYKSIIDKKCCRWHSLCKYLYLVMVLLLNKIFHPFKYQNWCPTLFTQHFWVNSECLVQNSEFEVKLRFSESIRTLVYPQSTICQPFCVHKIMFILVNPNRPNWEKKKNFLQHILFLGSCLIKSENCSKTPKTICIE